MSPAQRLIRRIKAARKLLGDKAYDSADLRQWLKDRGTKPVIPNRSNPKQPFSFDKKSYRQRHRIENAFGRRKDFRRIATRYDRLARNFLASVCLVALSCGGIRAPDCRHTPFKPARSPPSAVTFLRPAGGNQ